MIDVLLILDSRVVVDNPMLLWMTQTLILDLILHRLFWVPKISLLTFMIEQLVILLSQ